MMAERAFPESSAFTLRFPLISVPNERIMIEWESKEVDWLLGGGEKIKSVNKLLTPHVLCPGTGIHILSPGLPGGNSAWGPNGVMTGFLWWTACIIVSR